MKIIATIGPASSSRMVLKSLLGNGVDVCRFNFAHAKKEEFKRLAKNIRKMASEMGRKVQILQDLPGPKLRVGRLRNKKINLKKNSKVVLRPTRSAAPNHLSIPITYSYLSNDVKKGDSILISDGAIHLKVLSIDKKFVWCYVVEGGNIYSGNGINMPDSKLSVNAFTKKDKELLRIGLKQNVDWVGLSYVSSSQDIIRVRQFIKHNRRKPLLIAKIERREALQDIKSIIRASDGIMVARGDLGLECHFSRIPTIQRKLIKEARKQGKIAIVATQVLESMVDHNRPTRAEATDIANAVREGADAIMLSAETSIGGYPVKAVIALREVITAMNVEELKK